MELIEILNSLNDICGQKLPIEPDAFKTISRGKIGHFSVPRGVSRILKRVGGGAIR